MILLAFDTAGRGCAVGLWADGTAEALVSQPMAQGQAEILIPQIGAILEQAGRTWDQIDRLAVTIGPGSFTGLRVGLATAQGLALATGLPVVGLTTLEVFAHHAAQTVESSGARLVIPLVDARREDLYVQAFRREADGRVSSITPPHSLQIHEIADQIRLWQDEEQLSVPPIFCGDGLDLIEDLEMVGAWVPTDSPDLLTLAALAAKRNPAHHPPRPLYIRPPDAALPKNGGQIRPITD